eukprot:1552300-Ditylum_brightwellii.AAC.1
MANNCVSLPKETRWFSVGGYMYRYHACSQTTELSLPECNEVEGEANSVHTGGSGTFLLT